MAAKLPVPRSLHASLLRLSSQTDTHLIHLARVLSTPSGLDSFLCTLNYALVFLHARLSVYVTRKLKQFSTEFGEKAKDVMLPGEILVAKLPLPRHTAILFQSNDSLKKLADLIGDFRVFARLWGLLAIYGWGKATWNEPPRDQVLKRIAWAQVGVNAVYQVLENAAYLAQHDVLKWRKERLNTVWMVSSQFWMAHVVLDFGRLWRVWALRGEEGDKGKGEEKEEKMKREEGIDGWWRDLIVNAAFFPLTLHWSLEQGCVSDSWVGLLGTVAGTVRLKEAWKRTA